MSKTFAVGPRSCPTNMTIICDKLYVAATRQSKVVESGSVNVNIVCSSLVQVCFEKFEKFWKASNQVFEKKFKVHFGPTEMVIFYRLSASLAQ